MLKNWLHKKLSGNNNEKLVVGPEDENLSGLNLKEVLDAHSAWKEKLENELSGASSEPIDVKNTANDHLCTFGQWIYGPGKTKYSKLPEYETARKAHANFHTAAAEVVVEHQSGNTEKAQNLLKTKFRSASNNNQLELVRLFTAAKE
ncbi:MAG: hypothetical protein GXP08_13185 [Gammaproteobacteria bacterium]|nr:hypothetical protein [Gammaproteobacteria bacterium]